MCVHISVEFSTSWINYLVDPHRGVVEKVLCSDSKRFIEELAAAGKSSQKDVVKKWKLLAREREEVGDYLVHYQSVDPFILQFSDAILNLERLAEKAKEDARVDVRERRIEKCVVDFYPPAPRQTHEPSVGSGRNFPKMGGVKRLQLASQCTNRDS